MKPLLNIMKRLFRPDPKIWLRPIYCDLFVWCLMFSIPPHNKIAEFSFLCVWVCPVIPLSLRFSCSSTRNLMTVIWHLRVIWYTVYVWNKWLLCYTGLAILAFTVETVEWLQGLGIERINFGKEKLLYPFLEKESLRDALWWSCMSIMSIKNLAY